MTLLNGSPILEEACTLAGILNSFSETTWHVLCSNVRYAGCDFHRRMWKCGFWWAAHLFNDSIGVDKAAACVAVDIEGVAEVRLHQLVHLPPHARNLTHASTHVSSSAACQIPNLHNVHFSKAQQQMSTACCDTCCSGPTRVWAVHIHCISQTDYLSDSVITQM